MTITVVVSQEKSIVVSKEHISSLKDLKEKIKDEIGILQDFQIFVNKENLILSEKDFAELIHQENDVSLKFFVKGTDDLKMHSVCKKFNINSDLDEVDIHVFTTRQSVLESIKVSLGSKVSDIKITLDEYGINKDTYVIYHDDFDETEIFPLEVLDEGTFLVDLFFKDGKLTEDPGVHLIFTDDKEDDWGSMADTLSIPGIRLKNLSNDTVVLELDGHDIIDTVALKRKVKEELGIPVELQVFYLDDFFWEECLLIYKFSSYCDNYCGGFFEIEFFILPTEDSLVQKVCTENGIFILDPLSVINENGKLFEYSFGLNSTVGDLFSFISKELEIPALHLVLIAAGRELGGMETKIANIYEDRTEQEYSRSYQKPIVNNKVDVFVAVKGLLESSLYEICSSRGIKSLKTITVFYHDKNTLVEQYSISDVPSLDELSMKLRSHFGVFPPVLFFKNDYLKNQSLFHWRSSLAAMFFDEDTKSYHDNIDVVVCLDMASILVGDNDIALVNEFCSKHKVSCLQRIIVQFENQETKEMKVRNGLETIGNIKDLAEKFELSLKGDFVCNGKHFRRGKRLLEIYFENADATSDSLVFKYTPPAE